MKIKELFESDVTRPIAPVVYFHETSPEKLAEEVKEYIITGGWPDGHPNHKRVPRGIHEEYVHLLTTVTNELERPGGPDLPTSWISGFYGSGKSSFAKLLGLALDGRALPDGRSVAEAWLARDKSPKASELGAAWARLRQKVNPIAVVFDIGAKALNNEHIHAAIVRQVQRRLGYCGADPIVADFELGLERAGEWKRFEEVAQQVLGKPWSSVKDKALAEEDFSLVMSKLRPERYSDPMAWYTSRAGTHAGVGSPEDAVAAIRDMLKFRSPDSHLFIVVDEVSQYVVTNKDRIDRLRAFAAALGATLKGKAWLFALGQQKLDDDAGDDLSLWAKDRFPPKLRVHLSPMNIRDVVHRRLLAKKPEHEQMLRKAFEKAHDDLALFAYGTEGATPEDFAEVYPLLPGHIDLLLRITTALRLRSNRAQGDDQAIRGLLQLLGELFRDQKIADEEFGALITLDKIYEVQHTALDSDAQASMTRVLDQCAGEDDLLVRVAKAVAMLELIQETLPTDASLVTRTLYERIGQESHVQKVTDALEQLRRKNLLGYSEKHGYKLQSSAGKEWESERRGMSAPAEARSEIVQEMLASLLAVPEKPKLEGRPFSWEAVFSDGRQANDVVLVPSRDDATVKVDLRYLTQEDRQDSLWVRRSAESAFENVIVWVAGETDELDAQIRELVKSRAMVKKYETRRESMGPSRKMLLQQEQNNVEERERAIKQTVADAWMMGRVYFRGESIDPRAYGTAFARALNGAATSKLPAIYHSFVATTVAPSELVPLLESELSGVSPKFLGGDLGILETDAGRYVPSCTGVVPVRVLDVIKTLDGIGGATMLSRFGGPPYGYPSTVVKACIAGLLRAEKIRIVPESGEALAAIRDAGVKDVFEKDRAFRQASFFVAGDDGIGYQGLSRVCSFFSTRLGVTLERDKTQIADAVAAQFNRLSAKTRHVLERLSRLPGDRKLPAELVALQEALEACLRNVRQTVPTVLQVKAHLDVLNHGVQLLDTIDAELTADVLEKIIFAGDTRTHHAQQLVDLGGTEQPIVAAVAKLSEILGLERPWRSAPEAFSQATLVREAYTRARQLLLARQEELAENARSRVKIRDGFSILTNEQASHVLRPIAESQTSTTVEAVAPSLVRLRDAFDAQLQQAEERAIEILDELRMQRAAGAALIVKLDLGLKNREVGSAADVEAIVAEVREKLMKQLDSCAPGTRVRLL
ncbi:MAG: BREX system P-loop protein BrxC [Deltaproteobacteria bacterium]|nr:BREX system P-loop protein BrxC [Deltaproteobacteria bacterium]